MTIKQLLLRALGFNERTAPDENRIRKIEMQREFFKDTEEERKRQWLRTIRPRLKKGESGVWWCVSKHQSPQHVSPSGAKVYHRVGVGETPREAYESWMGW